MGIPMTMTEPLLGVLGNVPRCDGKSGNPHDKQNWRDKFQCFAFEWRDLFLVASVAAFNTLLRSQFPLLAHGAEEDTLTNLFDKDFQDESSRWVVMAGQSGTLLLCLVVHCVTTVFAVALPTPTGVVAPTLVIGALVGRVFTASLPITVFEFALGSSEGAGIDPGELDGFAARIAIIGAAAFGAAVFRTFAIAITMFEVLAMPKSVLQLSSASLTAMFVANKIALPFFDMQLVRRGLEGIALSSTSLAFKPVFSVMRRLDVPAECLSPKTSVERMRHMLMRDRATASKDGRAPATEFPIVASVNGVLLGSIKAEGLSHIIDTHVGDMTEEVNLLDPTLGCRASPLSQTSDCSSSGLSPFVNYTPQCVRAKSTVEEVYITMKVTRESIVYVTSGHCLVGVATHHELLGHHI